ncbi:reverse transcriptase domain-containing protein [Tanacetum coccineum]
MLSCCESSPSLSLVPLRDGWTDFRQEPSIRGISLKKPLSKGTVHHPKPPSSLKKFVTSSRKEMRHYTKLGNGPIPGMTPDQALTAIQTMVDHSQNWHDGSSSRDIESSSNSEGVAAIDCPLKEEVKSIEEAKYGEFRRPSPFSNGAKYHVGPPRYYTRIDNCLPFGEKRPSLEELMNKHLEESTRRRTEMEEWVKKLQENTKINTQNQSASLKNLDTQIEQLTKEFHAKTATKINNSSFDQCKAVYTDKRTPLDNEPYKVPFVSNKYTQEVQKKGGSLKVLPCQLPPKELNPGNFTLPCTIGSLNFYAMANLGASVNVITKSMFEHLKLAQLKKTDMLVEMADMTKRSPIGIVENVLVKINKFLFLSDFVVMDMLNTRNETMILERPFLATIHAEIDVFNKEISLGIGDDRATFDMDKKIHNFVTPVGKIYMVNLIHNEESPSLSNSPSDKSSRCEKHNNLLNENRYNTQERSSKILRMIKTNTSLLNIHFCKLVMQTCNGILKVWPTCDPTIRAYNRGVEIYGINENGNLKRWYCYLDNDRGSIKGSGLSFPEFLLAKYGEVQKEELIWDNSEPVKKSLLKIWLLDCFKEDVKDPRARSFDDYKWMFDLEIDQLADEYELGIGKKGHTLDDIWENCKKVQGGNTYWWHDQRSKEEERRGLGINIEEYDPPMDGLSESALRRNVLERLCRDVIFA